MDENEYALIFEDGQWFVRSQDESGVVKDVSGGHTLEEAIENLSAYLAGPVGIRLFVRRS